MAFGIGDAISIGSSIFGGSDKSNKLSQAFFKAQREDNAVYFGRSQNFQDKWNNLSLREAQRQYDHNLKDKLTYLVADAKRAGIHPLYALGASSGISPVSFSAGGGPNPPGSPGYSVVPEGNFPGTMEAVGNAISRRERAEYAKQITERQKALDKASLQESYYRSYKDWAIAQEALSNASRARQNVNLNQDGGGRLQNATTKQNYPNALTKNVPVEIPSSMPGRPSTQAGNIPLWEKRLDDKGNEVWFLNKDELEMMPAIISAYKTGKERLKKGLRGNRNKGFRTRGQRKHRRN
jgi:hypothetical protein